MSENDPQLEIAHVLFIDIVGYSRRSVDDQTAVVNRLNQLVRGTEHFRRGEAAGKLIRIPTGDGMALVFFTTPDAPVKCAIEISQADQADPKIELRMGIHSGPVDRLSDVNDRANITGAGINMAQRVMDCADSGHILLSQRIADDLGQYDRWRPHLHALGELEMKHGIKLGVVNFYSEGFGNPALPGKIATRDRERLVLAEREKGRSRRKRAVTATTLAIAAVVLVALAGIAYRMSRQIAASDRAAKAAGANDKSVAVLPFESVSADPENALLAFGIQEEIITRLAKIAALKVIARSSTKQYESRPASVADVARQLGVATLLEGSVQKIGEDVRVNVQLVKADTSANIWAETYNRKLVDVFGVESEVSAEIATALRTTLTPEEKEQVDKVPTRNLEAWAAYLKTRAVSDAHSSGNLAEEYGAIRELLERALVLDPNFALAAAELSLNESAWYVDVDHSPVHRTNARAEAERAIQLDPKLPEAHEALAFSYRLERDYSAAEKEYLIAVRLAPNDSELLRNMAMLMRRQNRWNDAISTLKRAVSLNPRSKLTNDWLGNVFWQLQDWSAAKQVFERSLALAGSVSPEAVEDARHTLAGTECVLAGNYEPMRRFLASANSDTSQDRYDLAMVDRHFEEAERIAADSSLQNFSLIDTIYAPKNYMVGCAAFARGDLVRAREILQTCLPKAREDVISNADEPQYHSFLGLLYAYLGAREDAIREGELATNLLPEAKDAVAAPLCEAALARIYARIGEPNRALALLGHLLVTPNSSNGGITLLELRTSWEWDALRNEKGFQKILNSPQPRVAHH